MAEDFKSLREQFAADDSLLQARRQKALAAAANLGITFEKGADYILTSTIELEVRIVTERRAALSPEP